MSGCRWVITPSWLSRWLRPFLYSSFVYSWHLFLMSFASVRPIPFLSFIAVIFSWNVPLVSLTFLKRSLVFPILFFPSISLHCSVKKAFLSLLASWNSAFRWVYLSFSPLSFACLFSDVFKAFLHQPYYKHKKSGGVEEISEKEERRSTLRPDHPRDSGQPSAVLLSLFLGPWVGRWEGGKVHLWRPSHMPLF